MFAKRLRRDEVEGMGREVIEVFGKEAIALYKQNVRENTPEATKDLMQLTFFYEAEIDSKRWLKEEHLKILEDCGIHPNLEIVERATISELNKQIENKEAELGSVQGELVSAQSEVEKLKSTVNRLEGDILIAHGSWTKVVQKLKGKIRDVDHAQYRIRGLET
ncbi:hypothetical protein GIB67_042290 [Kingdonia uniflora]|uniref:Uncharacterized protein n=1 Tax=Kingdonia uniflora TaxID=39325 RepID=A0A7J7LE24_9MAGN|nr:hypothetical protein GIB67_042290 [Kingdonia uniflora]